MLEARDLIEMQKMIASAAVIQSGAFKAELERIQQEQQKLTKMHGNLENAEAAKKARDEAEGIRNREKATAEEHEKLRRSQLQDIDSRKAALDEAVNAAKQAEQDAKAERETAVREQRRQEQAYNERQTQLEKQAKELEARAEKLQAGEQRLAEERVALDKAKRAIAGVKIPA